MSPSKLITPAILAAALTVIAVQYFQHQQTLQQLSSLQRQQIASSTVTTEGGHLMTSAAATEIPGSGPASLQEILSQRDPASRLNALLGYAEQIPDHMIEAVLKELSDQSPEWDPEAKLVRHLLLTRWAKEHPDAAYAHLSQLDFKKRGEESASILASLSALDPQRAAAWLMAGDNKLVDFPMAGHILAGTVGKEWVRQDPAAALAWARSLPENQRGGAYVGVLATLAGTDPAAAAKLANELEAGGARQNVIGDIAGAWAKKSPQQAYTWAQSLEGADRHKAMERAMSGWASHDPLAAAKQLEQLPADQITGGLIKSVVEPWTIQSPTAAAQWTVNQPAGEATNQALGSVMWNWTKQDPAAASSWLSGQPPGELRDAGISGLALATFDNDPAGALTWAANMADEGKRTVSVGIGMTEWLKRDAPSARTWAQNNGLALPSVPNPTK